MTSLGTAILLLLTTFAGVLGVACDSNPTPHPGQNKGDQADVSFGGGEVTGTELPPDPSDRDDDDLDPSTDEGTGGAAGENCADADASIDASDDNETRSSDDASTPESAEDCGQGDATPTPGAGADYGQVEGASTPTSSDSHPRRAH